MKKLILIIICIIFLSGCSATYELSVNGNTIKENLKIIETNKSLFDKVNDTGWTLRESFEALIGEDEFSNKDYEVKSLSNDNQLGIQYKLKNLDSIINSSVLNQCYSNPKLDVVDDIVTLDTGESFECYDYYENLETIKIVFKTNHKVISTNAQEVDGNTYIWNISKDSNKQIQISYYESIINNTLSPMVIALIIFGIVVFGIVLFIILKKVKNKNNF